MKSLYIKDISYDSFESIGNTHLDLKWGDNSLAYKSYAQATTEMHPRMKGESKVTYKDEDTEYFDPNHDDALVVSMRMINT